MCILNWYVAKLPHPNCYANSPHHVCRKTPFFDTLDIFKFFTFSNLRCGKNISHCLIYVSSFQEEANYGKISSSHEIIFKKYTACSVLVQFQLILYPGIHSTVKLEKWVLSRKVYCILETWMSEKVYMAGPNVGERCIITQKSLCSLISYYVGKGTYKNVDTLKPKRLQTRKFSKLESSIFCWSASGTGHVVDFR